ncbi:glycine/betaine ABC transporter substrate-binding protein [Demequina sediminis]|uniref:glycine betaine ABC transporter substrate-binding protein n=1 Tax=Demequina sediminis TaxID=1930058 RepID=UPI0025732A45|nr:glycine betaine ABC transporter substrate-binding protein [Demequina sediminis]BDZ61662.1 glycine/betaine ABC transporter substrate-binding protein [Demequina sediminis]
MNVRSIAPLALAATAGLVLAGCSSADSGDAPDSSADAAPAAGGEITFGVFNGWDESVASSLLWEAILEDKGYDVTLEYADPAVTFQALADGDYDLVTDVWLPVTHASYLDQFGDDIVEVGSWFDSAALTVAVNADAPIDSSTSSPRTRTPSAAASSASSPELTAAVEGAIPVYGLEGMDFLTSSTPAMLAELDSAMADGENIVVTLWEPHWAYGAYDLKNLEDPEGTLGDAEEIVTYSRTGFADEFPEVEGWLAGFSMDAELLYDLENQILTADSEDDYPAIVDAFIADNQEWVDSLTA